MNKELFFWQLRAHAAVLSLNTLLFCLFTIVYPPLLHFDDGGYIVYMALFCYWMCRVLFSNRRNAYHLLRRIDSATLFRNRLIFLLFSVLSVSGTACLMHLLQLRSTFQQINGNHLFPSVSLLEWQGFWLLPCHFLCALPFCLYAQMRLELHGSKPLDSFGIHAAGLFCLFSYALLLEKGQLWAPALFIIPLAVTVMNCSQLARCTEVKA